MKVKKENRPGNDLIKKRNFVTQLDARTWVTNVWGILNTIKLTAFNFDFNRNRDTPYQSRVIARWFHIIIHNCALWNTEWFIYPTLLIHTFFFKDRFNLWLFFGYKNNSFNKYGSPWRISIDNCGIYILLNLLIRLRASGLSRELFPCP